MRPNASLVDSAAQSVDRVAPGHGVADPLAWLETAAGRSHALVALLLFCDVRVCEALGLTWRDVGFAYRAGGAGTMVGGDFYDGRLSDDRWPIASPAARKSPPRSERSAADCPRGSSGRVAR